MIYHELFGQHLRLGNFLFKYAWSIAKEKEFGVKSCYPDYYLWNYLEKPPILQTQSTENIHRLYVNWEWSEGEERKTNKVINEFNNIEISLNSFFQSEKWFEKYKSEVWKSLQFKQEEVDKIKDKYSYLFNSKEYCPIIGIGVRLGDFQGHGDFYQIPIQWYLNTLEKNFPFWKERKIVVFSDDIVLARKLFEEKGYYFNYAEPNGTQTHADNFKHYHGDASEHLILGSMMDDFIIGNSTFSWWQAWLATYNKPLSKVIHCGKVFSEIGNMKHINTEHYYPKNWIEYK